MIDLKLLETARQDALGFVLWPTERSEGQVATRGSGIPATDTDSQWFHNNPDREFRRCRQTPAEFEAWPVPPESGMVAWCIIRKMDRAAEEFALADGDELDDYDEELVRLFDQLRDRTA